MKYLGFVSGNGDVWHGYADILVKRSVVKIAYKTDDGDGSGEPLNKRRRTESTEDEEDAFSDESCEFENIDEVKKDVIDSHTLSQGLAQTIVNAFCEAKKDSALSNLFIPSFITTGQNLKICMYNCDIDRLVMTKNLDLFLVEDHGSVPFLNLKTIMCLWYVLNFDIAFDTMEPESEALLEFLKKYYKSNFEELAGHQYSAYKENCTKPMTAKMGRRGCQDYQYEISPDFFCEPCCICCKKNDYE